MEHEAPASRTQQSAPRPKPAGRELIALLVVLALAIVVTSLYAHWNVRFPGDLTLVRRFQALRSNPLTQAMKAASAVGGSVGALVLVIAAAFLFWLKRHRPESLIIIAVGLLNLAGRELKFVVDRPRPSPDLVAVGAIETSSSFPSGHAIFAMAFFGAMCYFAGVYIRNVVWKRVAQVVAVVLIVLIGASRVYLGVHWPSDVAGGYLVGGLILTGVVLFHRRTTSS